LFFVPTGSGDCSYAVKLGSEMDIDCPVYALPWPDFNELCPPTLEEMAARALLRIKDIQPSGPYRFAGYSSGGILAYAIAQHLLRLGEAISFMAFIDVELPENGPTISPTKIINELVLVGLESLDDERFAELERFAEQSSTVQLLEKAQEIGAIPSGRDLHADISRYEKAATFQRMLNVYEAPSLPVEIHQFYANGPCRRRAKPPEQSIGSDRSSPFLGWQRILSVQAIRALPIPGDHETMMSASENRQVLAQRLSTALRVPFENRG
ncbi:MAG: hypothetical protein E5Y89_15475, partial [Mesorhizobium sp.]